MTVIINGTTGITSPEVVLDNSAADGGQVVLKSSGYSNWSWDNYNGRLRAYYNVTEYFTIDTSGNVGIGTSSPGAKLDVSGTFRTGDVTNLYGTASSLRGINFGSNEIAWAQGTTSCFLNLCSTTGNSGASYSLVIRGLNSNGGAAATLSYITLDATSLYFTGSGGASQMFPCRAWVNFNGTGTVAIRASGNVSSITDNGTGDYTVNFTNAMPDSNYCAVGCAGRANDGNNYVGFDTNTYSTTQVKFFTKAAGSAPNNTDMTGVYIAIFR